MNEIPWLSIVTADFERQGLTGNVSDTMRASAASIAESLQEAADSGDHEKIFMLLGDVKRIIVLLKYPEPLLRCGVYEKWVIDAYTHKPFSVSPWVWALILSRADKSRLRACGQPLPTGESHILYRGTPDSTVKINRRGISWTANPNTAAWFALELFSRPQKAPAVYQLVVPESLVYFYMNDRGEQEFVVAIGKCGRIKRIPMPEPIKPSIVKPSKS